MNIEYQFLFILLAIIFFFTFLIISLLKLRMYVLKKNLTLTANDVWPSLEKRAMQLGFKKHELLYGIIQDHSLTEASLILRNFSDDVLGITIYPTAKRKRIIKIENHIYSIEFPLTMNKTAILRKEDGQEVLARYARTSWLGKHEFEIPGHGKFISSQPFLNWKSIINYMQNGKVMGTIQKISLYRECGKLALLPESLPLEIRLFILSV